MITQHIMGLDIQTDSISAALVKKTLKGVTVLACHQVALEDDDSFEITLSKGLDLLSAKMNITDSPCVVSPPLSHISFRKMHLPFKDHRKIEEILPYELEPLMPEPIESLYITSYIPPAASHVESTEIIAITYNRDFMETIMGVLLGKQVKLKRMLPSSIASGLCFRKYGLDLENSIFLDVQPDNCTLLSFVSGSIHMARSCRMNKALDPVDFLQQTVRQSIAAARPFLNTDVVPDQIYINTPGHDFAGGVRIGDHDVSIPVIYANLIKEAGLDTLSDIAHVNGSGCDNSALAIALCDIENVKTPHFWKNKAFSPEQYYQANKAGLAVMLMTLVLILGMGAAIFILDANQTQKQVQRLDQTIKKMIKDDFPEVTNLELSREQLLSIYGSKVSQLEKQVNAGLGDAPEVPTIDILAQLSQFITKEIDIKLKQFVKNNEGVILSGDTDTYNSVTDMKNRLLQSTLIKKVDIGSTSADRSGRITFKISITLN